MPGKFAVVVAEESDAGGAKKSGNVKMQGVEDVVHALRLPFAMHLQSHGQQQQPEAKEEREFEIPAIAGGEGHEEEQEPRGQDFRREIEEEPQNRNVAEQGEVPLEATQHAFKEQDDDRHDHIGDQQRERALDLPRRAELQQAQRRQQRDYWARKGELKIEMETV